MWKNIFSQIGWNVRCSFDVRSKFDSQMMNMFVSVQCSKTDVRVCSMSNRMMFDTSLLTLQWSIAGYVVVRPTNFSTCKYFDIHRNQHTHFSTYMISSCMYFNILQFDMHNNSTYIFSTSNSFNINIISTQTLFQHNDLKILNLT